MRGRKQHEIMRAAGYCTAKEAAAATGYAFVGSIHRRIHDGELEGSFVGNTWYVKIDSLLQVFSDAPPIVQRLQALKGRTDGA